MTSDPTLMPSRARQSREVTVPRHPSFERALDKPAESSFREAFGESSDSKRALRRSSSCRSQVAPIGPGPFHHDTNPAGETGVINGTELRGFVQRALAFTRR